MKKNRFSYWFDNQMSGGTAALIKLLTVASVVTVLIMGIIIAVAGAGKGLGFGSGVWISLTHVLDPGTICGDGETGTPFIFGMLIVTVIGIFIFSTLTGIICNAIDEKVQELRKGRSVVVEEGHVIILGAAGGLYTMVSELIEANSNHKREALVIMDDRDDRDVMDDRINERFPDKKTTRIICRCGNISDINDLKVCSFDTCRSVIINAESDAATLKCILAVTKLLKEYGNDKAYITAVIRDEENKEAAEVAGEGFAEILSFNDVMSRIIAHTGRNAGLSQVYTEIFDTDGSEFYIEEHPDAVGRTLSELNRYFPVSTVIGFVRSDGRILLNPEPDLKVEKGDRLILFAEDDGESRMDASPHAVREEDILKEYRKEPLETKDMLILGYSGKLKFILEEEDNYVAPGSKMTVALDAGQASYREEIEGLNLKNIEVTVMECDSCSRSVLESLLKEDKDNTVLVLADSYEGMDEKEAEKKDARILLILLQLKYLSESRGIKMSVTSEMLRVENQELAEIAEVNDFVISSNITSLIVTQICQERNLRAIFEELLKEEGSEIYVRPAGNYIKTGQKTDIYTAGEAAARQREVLIGYRKTDKTTGNIEIVTNPPKAAEVVFEEQDAFVVIAVD
ncbi:MAG: hypothetical protein K5985_06150 [Lachnospiraceae bacterium]|nr:hypothetical protein [Lachnospiraceae bacterium]